MPKVESEFTRGQVEERVGLIRRGFERLYVNRKDREHEAHPHVYASAWRACDRRIVLEMTKPEEMPKYEPDVLARFSYGDDRERDRLSDLDRVGRMVDPSFKVVGGQMKFQHKKGKRVIISGKIDAEVEFDDRLKMKTEVKAWDSHLVARIYRFSDLFDNRWTRSGAYQLLSYLLMSGEQFGLLVLDRPGLPKLLIVDLYDHLDEAEAFLTKAERACDHYDAGTLPDFIDDPNECKHCPFYGSACNPPLSFPAGDVVTDEQLLIDIERFKELEGRLNDEEWTEYNSLDKSVKARLRGVEMALAGPFLITGKWGKQTNTVWPDEETKRKYQVTNPKGKFTVTIERLPE